MNIFKKMIKQVKYLDNAMTNQKLEEDRDIDVLEARANYQKYQDGLEKRRQEYKKQLAKEIRIASIMGNKCIETVNVHEEFMTYEFLKELKSYFESKGFTVRKESAHTGLLTDWLVIEW